MRKLRGTYILTGLDIPLQPSNCLYKAAFYLRKTIGI